MGGMQVSGDAKEASISAVVIRADGRREDLGVIAYYHKNPLRRLLWAAKQKLPRR